MANLGKLLLIADHLEALKAYLAIEGDEEDERLRLWFEGAVEHGDAWLDVEFPAGPLPSGVVVGVYEFVKAVRSWHATRPGLTSVKTGQLAETYAPAVALNAGIAAAIPWWRPWKRDLSLAGSA